MNCPVYTPPESLHKMRTSSRHCKPSFQKILHCHRGIFYIIMKFLSAIAFALAACGVSAKEDLPSDASLRIGVKFRPATCERKTKNGDKLSMHYTGTLYKDGSQFDSSVGRGPFDFTLGRGMVIKGWDNGLQDVRSTQICVLCYA